MVEAAPMNRIIASEGIHLPATDNVRLTLAAPAARFILRGGPDAASKAGAAFGLALPHRLAAVEAAGRAALWLGPDEWLLLAPADDAGVIAADLAAALRETPHSLVDVSHRQIGFMIEGPGASRVLSAGCPLDLRPHAFPAGMAVRTLFAKAEIILWRQDANRFHLEVWRSFAPYLTQHLEEASIAAQSL